MLGEGRSDSTCVRISSVTTACFLSSRVGHRANVICGWNFGSAGSSGHNAGGLIDIVSAVSRILANVVVLSPCSYRFLSLPVVVSSEELWMRVLTELKKWKF